MTPLKPSLELHQPRIYARSFLDYTDEPNDAALKIIALLFISDLLSRLSLKYKDRAITPSILHTELMSIEQFDCLTNLFTTINEQ